ncbi:MAG: DUF3887 domain-containing protein [Candidatus Thermoplasmatota archaeon]
MKNDYFKKINVIFLILVLLLTGCIQEDKKNGDKKDVEKNIEEIAKELMIKFETESYAYIYNSFFTEEVKKQVNPGQLEGIWKQITTTYGDFIDITSIRGTQEQGYNVVYVTCKYSKGFLDTRVVFNQDKLIAGFQFAPSESPEQYQTPVHVNKSLFIEKNVTISTGTKWELPATLTKPIGEGPFPAVVLVHGSGANDRNETIGPNKPFKDLAWGLGSRGVIVLRYEKRTKQYPHRMSQMISNLTVEEETINDSLKAIELLKKETNSSNIYVLGHSLGATLAPRIAKRTDDLSGIVMMAAAARPIEDLVLNQTLYLSELDGKVTDEEQNQIKSVMENVTKIKNLNISEEEVVLGGGLAYWKDLSEYDPVGTGENLTIPILILQGKRDYQVTYEDDFKIWNQTLGDKGDVVLISYPSLNHIFMSGSGQPSNEEYFIPGNISEKVIRDISEWIKK